jgi:hypothetical protein
MVNTFTIQVLSECIIRSSITSYSSPNIIRIIKSRRMRWAEHVARIRERRKARRDH